MPHIPEISPVLTIQVSRVPSIASHCITVTVSRASSSDWLLDLAPNNEKHGCMLGSNYEMYIDTVIPRIHMIAGYLVTFDV